MVGAIYFILIQETTTSERSKIREESEKFITTNPFDLAQIKGFSKYRSCEGHDYRYPSITGEMEATPRSMKHYVVVKEMFRGTVDQIDVFAPFNGKISNVEDEFIGGSQVWLAPNQGGTYDWQFVFFHLKLDEDKQKGVSVSAGEHIGTANLRREHIGTTDNFDFALRLMRPLRQPAVDAPFNYATQELLAEYSTYGITIDNLIISKEERDARPCQISPNTEGTDIRFPTGIMADDYVWL
ncbi:MAG: hypothetical protein AAB833_01955 [Patescibacteria group bacterium]